MKARTNETSERWRARVDAAIDEIMEKSDAEKLADAYAGINLLMRAIEHRTWKSPAYAKAAKTNNCGGYCENPYACSGGCYEY